MRVCGFSFVRNAIRFDYPFEESILSALPLCDDFVLVVGKSDDATLERARKLDPTKVRIIETVWDDSLREGGAVLAQQTNIALGHAAGDWLLYLQADEVIHEADVPAIRSAMDRWREDRRVEGLLFDFIHFYGGYGHVGTSRRWYRSEVRIVRPIIPGLRSWKDAQGFRAGERKLNVRRVAATIYHYGWVKPPAVQQAKQRSFNRLWHGDSWMEKHVGAADSFPYADGGRLVPFTGTHPRTMLSKCAQQDWAFAYDPARTGSDAKTRVLDLIERHTGLRLGEYRNYRLLRGR